MERQNQHEIPVIAFVGRSGCGKTTLLERVVPLLLQRGIRLAVVKHTQHKGIISDAEGTDTSRMWDAGVPAVVLVSGDSVVQWQRFDNEPGLDQVLTNVSGVDLIILEGFKSSAVSKIEVLRQAHYVTPLAHLKARIAYATDLENMDTDLPTFALDDFVGIADFLQQYMVRQPT